MKRTTTFAEICDELENICNEKCVKNEVKCVRKKILNYIEGDYDKFLKLKAEAKETQNMQNFISSLLVIVNFVITSLNFLVNNFYFENLFVKYFALIVFILFLIFTIYIYFKYRSIRNWRKYIIIVLDEYEKQIHKQQ